MSYDSTPDTLKHSLRVGALVGEMIKELVDRSVRHDLSKTAEPELSVFNAVTPQLAELAYGTPEYTANLATMGEALAHHYANNPHHPQCFRNGINGMTLVDLMEMLADWKAAGERHAGADLADSLTIGRDRFAIGNQLLEILTNTAAHFGWLAPRAAP